MGIPTLVANGGVTTMSVADVDGVKIAGVLFDAGTANSPCLLQVGPAGSSVNHAANPTVLYDVSTRIGGATAGKVTTSIIINSDNVIGDNLWLWRADHGNNNTVGWTINTCQNAIIINGNNVIMYALACEHCQQYQTLWNGNGGRTYFYQSECPYDPPNQGSWMDGSVDGFASYKVTNSVTSHNGWGIGVYTVFNNAITLESAIECPATAGIGFTDECTVNLGAGNPSIVHIINNDGNSVGSGGNFESTWVGL